MTQSGQLAAASATRANISSRDNASNVGDVNRDTRARFFAARFFVGFLAAAFSDALRFAEDAFAFRADCFFAERVDFDPFVAMRVLPPTVGVT